ncbi:MAG: UDP-N-acetylmuramoyl-tripeptide--D-alanyl-D-alanine ligase [Lachnospiraceae bacterium]|nr:UDP-N-acetylmuramoyl-tripeptide--D-alanyl-D-alanine ligase [Lachnospiraceae bacterium]
MLIVRTAIAVVLSGYALFLVMRHNMHMFQLNGYKNDEHIRWIKKNIRQQWLLGFGLLLAIPRIFFPLWGLDIAIWLTLLLDIVVYRAMHRMNSKKKLVYTPRVKRMIATIIILVAAVIVPVVIFFGIKPVAGVLMTLVSLQLIMNIVANVINHPMEKAVSNHFINDAKRMLKARPDLKIIGVTGSYGKTSMKFYLQTLLQSRYNVLVTPGNFNTPLGVTRTVREHLKPTHEIFICEMGARRVGEIKEICDMVHPDLGIITSVGPQHLETFFSMENIQKTKFELADAIPEEGMVFLNGDNEYIREKATEYPKKMFYFTDEATDSASDEASVNGSDNGKISRSSDVCLSGYRATDISVSQFGTEFTVVAPNGDTERFQMKLIGAHNVINVVGAIAAANYMGISLKELKIPVRKIQPVEHRMQMKEHGLVTIIDDAYNSNPVGSKAAVETLAMFDGIRILVTPGMVELGDKEEEYNFKFGTYAAHCCDYILLVGRRHTVPIREGVLSEKFPEEKCLVYDKLEDALAYAYAIKGQGHKYILLENDLPDNY